MFPDSFEKVSNISQVNTPTHSITVSLHKGQIPPLEAGKEIDAQLKDMTVQDITACQVGQTPLVSSLTNSHKCNGIPRVFLASKDLNKAISMSTSKPPD